MQQENFSSFRKKIDRKCNMLYNFYIIFDEFCKERELCMDNKNERVERTVMSLSISVNDKGKLKELAVKNEMTVSALLSKWIREHYESEVKASE